MLLDSSQAIEDTDNAKKYQFLSEILRWRANTTPDHVIYTLINTKGQEALKVSCADAGNGKSLS